MAIPPHCLNCGHNCSPEDSFCPKCGQKRDENKLTVRALIKNFLSAIVNYDSSFWRTLRDIFIPGKLTLNYIKGQRKSYLNPVRFFIIMAIINLLISNISTQYNTDLDLRTGANWIQREALENKIIDKLGLEGSTQFPNDSIRNLYYTLSSFHSIDSTSLQDSLTEPFHFDSLEVNINLDNSFNVTTQDIAVDYRDVYDLQLDDLFDKYQISSKWDQIILGQTIKLVTKSDSFAQYIGTKISWMFFILIPLQGLAMMLFYRKKTYVEHLIYLLHIHTLAFLMLILIKLSMIFLSWISQEGLLPLLGSLGVIGLLIYSFITGQRVYKERWYWTLLKLIPLSISYWLFLAFSLLLLLILGAVIF